MASGGLPEPVVGGVRDLLARPRGRGGAVGGGGREPADGRDPLDVRRAGEAAAVGPGAGRGGGQPQPLDRGGVDGHTRLLPAHHLAAVPGFPRRTAVMRGDELAVVAVEVCPRRGRAPAVPVGDRDAVVDLHARRVSLEEELVAGEDLDFGRDAGVGGLRGGRARAPPQWRRRPRPRRFAGGGSRSLARGGGGY